MFVAHFQARACLPAMNSLTRPSWHLAQVSGPTIPAFATSAAEVCAVPWQVSHPTPFSACFEAFQSVTNEGDSF